MPGALPGPVKQHARTLVLAWELLSCQAGMLLTGLSVPLHKSARKHEDNWTNKTTMRSKHTVAVGSHNKALQWPYNSRMAHWHGWQPPAEPAGIPAPRPIRPVPRARNAAQAAREADRLPLRQDRDNFCYFLWYCQYYNYYDYRHY